MPKAQALLIWLVAVLIVGGIGWWGYKEFTRPIVGEQITDMGRDHVSDISGVTYNSDPPTSGPHFPVWAKKGVYDRVISDGHLVHSLEHGYIVISYNCTRSISNSTPEGSRGFQISNLVYAHEVGPPHEEPATGSATLKPLTKMTVEVSDAMSFFTPQNPPEVEVELPESFQSEECKKLVRDLANFGNDFERIVVVPRPSLDTKIALTAWNRLLKLDSFDGVKIKQFIQVFHNRGPEKTQE